MRTMNERISKLNEKIDSLEKKRRIEKKRIKDAEKKLKQRRFYVVGEIVVKNFPELEKLIPATKTKDKNVFAGFEYFLRELSSNDQIMQLYRKCLKPEPENHGNV